MDGKQAIEFLTNLAYGAESTKGMNNRQAGEFINQIGTARNILLSIVEPPKEKNK